MKNEQPRSLVVQLYYRDHGWDPLVPINAFMRARLMWHPRNRKVRVVVVRSTE